MKNRKILKSKYRRLIREAGKAKAVINNMNCAPNVFDAQYAKEYIESIRIMLINEANELNDNDLLGFKHIEY